MGQAQQDSVFRLVTPRVRGSRTWRPTIALWLVVILGITTASGQAIAPVTSTHPATGNPIVDVWHWLGEPFGWLIPPADLPPTPQQPTGTADGKSHVASAADTQADGTRAAGKAPGKAPGELDDYAPHVQPVTPELSAKRSGEESFDPATSTRVSEQSSAESTMYRNADGSYTRHTYAGPVNFRTGDGTWQPIDTTLADDGQRLRSAANAFGLSLAHTAADPVIAMLATQGRSVGYGLSGAAAATASVSGSTVTYRDVLPDTDLELQSTPGGLKETLILRSAKAPASWSFPLSLNGVTAAAGGGASVGSVEFRDAAGQLVASVPPGSMMDAKAGSSTAVTQQLVTDGGVTALRLQADQAWLSSSDRAFPVRVDPTLDANEYSSETTYASSTMPGDHSTEYQLRVGTPDGGATEKAYSFLEFANFGSHFAGNQITAASLHVYDHWASSCAATPFTVNRVTSAWTPTGVTSYPGPSFDATAIGSLSTSPGSACTNGANAAALHDPSVGLAMTVGLDAATFRNWVAGSANYGLALTSSQTDSSQFKIFNSSYGPHPPYLALTYAPDVAPQVDTQYPPNNYSLPNLTPTLFATGHDPDAFPSALQYRFSVYDIDANELANSGLIDKGEWAVPSGLLRYAKSYLYTVQAFDGYTYSPSPKINLMSAGVPQPAVTSKLSQNADGRGFDPRVGNYTTSTVDAQVASVGPAATVVRNYNSYDPRRDRSFGEGWSSILDAKATEQTDPDTGVVTTVTVTYPDGQEASFGRNPDGSYGAPPGRFAVFTKLATGGYSMVDKQNSTYNYTDASGAAGRFGLSSIVDSLGRTLTLHYTGGLIDKMTSASGRSLTLTWSTPTNATSPHVATVVTDPVTTSPTSKLTWKYTYSADSLTKVCSPLSTTACTKYTYASNNRYRMGVLDIRPTSYWPLADAAGTVATSQSLVNQGTDNATYTSVTLKQTGPLAGSGSKAVTLNGTTSVISLPETPLYASGNLSVALWFKTTVAGGVLFSYQTDAITSPSVTGGYTPALYVGSDGKLRGEFWNGTAAPITSAAAVTDGVWHHVVLSAADDTQTMFVDGVAAGSLAGHISSSGQRKSYVGGGFNGGGWPGQPNSGAPAVTRFTGSVSDVAFYSQTLDARTASLLSKLGRTTAKMLSSIIRPSTAVGAAITYDTVTGTVKQVTDANGGVWKVGAPTVSGTSQVYAATVRGSGATGYWRMDEGGGSADGVDIAGAAASMAYHNVTLGVPGVFGPGENTAMRLDGTSSYGFVRDWPGSYQQPYGGAELWFNTTTAGSVLIAGNGAHDSEPNPASTDNYPVAWIGTDSKVHISGLSGGPNVTDGAWHQLALGGGPSGESLFVDGVEVAHNPAYTGLGWSRWTFLGVSNVGEGSPTDALPAPGVHYFSGSMDEFSWYSSELLAGDVAAHYAAYRSANGPAPMRTVVVTDPGNQPITYDYDMRNGDRLIRKTDSLGHTTTYGYDSAGFAKTIVDPNGNATVTGHDVRGNVVSLTTCQFRADHYCSTKYFTYYPDATTPIPTPDPRNDLLLTQRDGRSSSATDPTYLTSFGYDTAGNQTSMTTPPVAGYPSGRVMSTAYTDGTSVPASDGGFAPPGLAMRITTPGGAISLVTYTKAGDVATVTDSTGVVTSYTFDGLGRVLTRKVTSSAYPAGLTTTLVYDKSGAVVSSTDPPALNRVTGATHKAVTTNTYNVDGQIIGRTVADATGGDASRTVSIVYNTRGQVASTTDASGAVTTYEYDAYGNKTAVITNGRRIQSTYDPNGHVLTQVLAGYVGDPNHPSTPADLTLASYAYDPAGRLATQTDAMGRVNRYEYRDNGLVDTVYRNDGTVGGAETLLEMNSYDEANNLINRLTDDAKGSVSYTVDAANRTIQMEGPGYPYPATDYTYSADDSLLSSTLNATSHDADWNWTTQVVAVTDNTYDPLGRLTSRTVHGDGAAQYTTSWTLDQRGLATSATDPLGNVTTYTYDELGRLVVSSSPIVNVEVGGGAPVAAHAISRVGYDTFGSQTQSQDSAGEVTTTAYDAAGRPLSVTGPSYLAPGASTPVVPVSRQAYNQFGQVASVTDPLNQATTFTYDQLGRTASQTNADTGVAAFAYDPLGELLSVTDPTGAVTQATYDYLGRATTLSQVVRQPTPAANTTQIHYDGVDPGPKGGPWLTKTTTISPNGVTASSTENYVGQVDFTTDGHGNENRYTYDAAGRLVKTTLPDGSGSTATYDFAGRLTAQSTVDSQGATLATASFGYDAAGRTTSVTDARGHATTYSYDRLGRVTGTVEPVSATTSITSSFGYDANGNQTRFTDGRGNAFINTYNSWGLPESQVEPTTTAYPTAADRTFTAVYDAAGNVAQQRLPGNVTVDNTYDPVGRLTGQTGAGAEAATANRTFSYDLAGQLTSATGPDGSNSFTYDDRGLLLTATGQSGASSFAYGPDGEMTARTDAAGTTSYGYDDLGRLHQATDPLTNTQETLDYNTLSQLTRIGYGTNGNARTFSYDPAHRLASDTVSNNLGGTLGSIVYGYDVLGNETSKITTGLAGSAANAYTYDFANRLTTWTADNSTKSYGYDASGNRTAVAGVTYTYDARNEVSGGGGTGYAYTARGTLKSTTTTTGTDTVAYDAFNQLISAGTRDYKYDALGRMRSFATGAGTPVALTYTGAGNDVASDGSFQYSRDPGGGLLAEKGGGAGVLTWADKHTDVIGQFTATSALTASGTYDPFGSVIAASGLTGNIGFQSGWTDPSTGKTNMYSRWYDPAVGGFTARDTIGIDPVGSSINANRYAYVGANPLGGTDPSGHCPGWLSAVCGAASYVAGKATQAYNYVATKVSQAYNYVSDQIGDAYDYVVGKSVEVYINTSNAAQQFYNTAQAVNAAIVDTVKHEAAQAAQIVQDAQDWAQDKADRAGAWVEHQAAQAWDATKAVVDNVATYVDEHKQQILAGLAGVVVGVGVFAGCMAFTGGVGSIACAVLAGEAGGAVAGAIACPEGTSMYTCVGVGVIGGAAAGAVGALVFAGAAALGAGAALAGAISGAAGSAGGDIVTQLVTTGTVDWGEVGFAAAVGGVLGGIGGKFAPKLGGGRSPKGGEEPPPPGRTATEEPPVPGRTASEEPTGSGRSPSEEPAGSGRGSSEEPAGPGRPADEPSSPGRAADEPSGTSNSAGESCPNSFAGSTPVLTGTGDATPIDQLRVGDRVLATDPEHDRTESEPIIAIIVGQGVKHLVELTIDTDGAAGDATGKLVATDNHPFWVPSAQVWRLAGALKDGDDLRTSDGRVVTVAAVRAYTEVARVYNLTVASEHTYYVVAGGTAVLVHNAGSGGPASPAKGQAGVNKLIQQLLSRGYTIRGTEISMTAANGVNVRLDVVAEKNGVLSIYDAKNGPSAVFQPKQLLGYPSIEANGGTFYGPNAQRAGLLGQRLGATRVNIAGYGGYPHC